MQKLNGTVERTVFGIVTNGERWEIAKLQARFFTKEKFF